MMPAAEMITTGKFLPPDFSGWGDGEELISDSAVAVGSIISRLTSGSDFSSASAKTCGDKLSSVEGKTEVVIGVDVGVFVGTGVAVAVGFGVDVGESIGVGEGVADGCGEEFVFPLVGLIRVKNVPVLSGFLPMEISLPGLLL